jgi:ribosome biogenesis protein SSF1/2
MPRKGGGKRRKRRTHVVPAPGTAISAAPRSLVFRRGKIPAGVRELVPDIRRMLMPNTALNLKEKRFNNIRDYVSVSAQLGISHFLIFSATERGPYLRFCKVPQGPTLTFRLVEYSLAADIRSVYRRPASLQDGDFLHAPLLVLNNFASTGKADKNGIALTAEMFRRSFPAIDVKTAKLKTMRRVVLVDRDEESDCIRLRQYAIRVQPAGLSRPVRKMTVRGKVPKLSNMTDVAELIDGTGNTGAFSSDSEMDDTPLPVTLPQPVKNLRRGANSVIRLVEVGPRLTLQLIKAEAGLCEGAVLFHRYKVKGKSEIADTERRIAEKQMLKRKRREEQEANVEQKHATKRAKRERHKVRVKQWERAGKADVEQTDHLTGNKIEEPESP